MAMFCMKISPQLFQLSTKLSYISCKLKTCTSFDDVQTQNLAQLELEYL